MKKLLLALLVVAVADGCERKPVTKMKGYPRWEFEKIAADRSVFGEDGVYRWLGAPKAIKENEEERQLKYVETTHNPATGKTDPSVWITIERKTGKILRIDFESAVE